MGEMKHANVINFLLCCIMFNLLISCAGSGVRKTAQSEFDSGLSFFNRGQYEESIPHFERATRLVPKFWEAHMFLGRAYLNLKKWREALPPLKTAFQLEPQESQRKSAGIIMDIFFRNTSKIDQDVQSEFMEILKLK
jgi:tetratricopeptide (TPR) repeat protein